MGQREAFTSQDVDKINKMYKCLDGAVEEEKPTLNAHNNVAALIGDLESTTTSTSKPSAHAPSRPNRPFLHLVGNLIGLNRN